MKQKFWQKTFLLTLAAFLICLNAGVFTLAIYTHNRDLNAECAGCRAELNYLVQAFNRDYEDLMAAGEGADPVLLMDSYCSFYAKRGVLLEYSQDGKILSGAFPEAHRDIAPDTEGFGQIGKDRFFFISTLVCERAYTLVYGRSFAETDGAFRSLMIAFTVISLALSTVLAAALYFILKRVSAPLANLQKATERIAAGDSEVRADEQAPGEFGQLGKSFNEMVGKLDDQMEELKQNAVQKQRLVDDLAHEIRTPLTVIYGYAEYLRRAGTTEEEKINCAISVIHESQRLWQISEKLLDDAVLRENALKTERVELDALLRETATSLLPIAAGKEVLLSVKAEPAFCTGDRILLDMLFYNLAENAIKACEPGGHVVLGCASGETGSRVRVSDDGRGMTPEQIRHVTEPFYRTDVSRSRASGGAGLGLFLCSRIVDKHGACLTFDSAPGKGTTVSVSFPKDFPVDNSTMTI